MVQMAAIPVISAVTGYITNYIAVRMLFRPQRERRFFGLRIQGLIPRRRTQIAQSIGETVEQHLISHEDVRAALDNPQVADRIRELMDSRISDLITEKVPKLHPMASMFLNEAMIDKLKGFILEEVMNSVAPMTDQVLGVLEENLNFRQMVVEKIEGFDLETFEDIVLRIARRELRSIEILGGVLGFCIGLVTDLILLIPV